MTSTHKRHGAQPPSRQAIHAWSKDVDDAAWSARRMDRHVEEPCLALSSVRMQCHHERACRRCSSDAAAAKRRPAEHCLELERSAHSSKAGPCHTAARGRCSAAIPAHQSQLDKGSLYFVKLDGSLNEGKFNVGLAEAREDIPEAGAILTLRFKTH
eukprot:6187566-Pleurochrysis_carterae.AAC.2